MKWTAITAAALLARETAAQGNMLRFACSQLVVERTDPLVMPGVNPSPHVHQIVGGNSFNLTMEPVTYNLATRSTCTSCSFPQDKSNYWTAAMYFRRRDGRYHRVPQVGNGGPQGQLVNDGGLAIYYIPSGTVRAYAEGFRMFAGSATETNPSNVNRGNICHRCWNQPSENTFVGQAPCTGSDTVDIPNSRDCYYIRQTVIFPACWDGVNLDSPNHRDHVTYSGTGATGGGNCPSSHPVKLPQLMYEIMFDVREFRDAALWPTDGSNPFRLAMGIGGSATHGDYMFGWEGTTLQRAMDNRCNLDDACPAAGLTFQQPAQYNACKKAQMAVETVEGWLDCLPGFPNSCASGTGNPPASTTGQPPASTTRPPTQTSSQPPSGNCAARWGQCGGEGWTGATCCQSGSTCQAQNQWYSQCL